MQKYILGLKIEPILSANGEEPLRALLEIYKLRLIVLSYWQSLTQFLK